MKRPRISQRHLRLTALSVATAAIVAFSASALAISQSGEAKICSGRKPVRSSGAFGLSAKHHRLSRRKNDCVRGYACRIVPNPLNGGASEPNGTMIMDATWILRTRSRPSTFPGTGGRTPRWCACAWSRAAGRHKRARSISCAISIPGMKPGT